MRWLPEFAGMNQGQRGRTLAGVRPWHALGLLSCCGLLSACGSTPSRPAAVAVHGPAPAEMVDSAPPPGMDLSGIPEAVPKVEARSRYGNHSPYTVYGKRYEVLPESRGYVARGIASWYGTKFHGRLTSNREPYDMYAYTAAHKTLPLPAYARVTNLENGRTAVVRINDRGPFVGDRLIDLSYVAAVKLGVHIHGTAPVEVRVIEPEGSAAAPAIPASATPYSVSTQAVLSNPSAVRIQCGAFGSEDNARMLQARLRQAGFPQPTVEHSALTTPYRVLIGPYVDRDAAMAAMPALTRQGFHGCQVRSEP